MDITMKLYLCGIAIGYLLGFMFSMVERQLRHLTYFDGYKEGLNMALKLHKSVRECKKESIAAREKK